MSHSVGETSHLDLQTQETRRRGHERGNIALFYLAAHIFLTEEEYDRLPLKKMMTELKSQAGGANKEIDTACHLEGQI